MILVRTRSDVTRPRLGKGAVTAQLEEADSGGTLIHRSRYHDDVKSGFLGPIFLARLPAITCQHSCSRPH
jgi:hypothetical protein